MSEFGGATLLYGVTCGPGSEHAGGCDCSQDEMIGCTFLVSVCLMIFNAVLFGASWSESSCFTLRGILGVIVFGSLLTLTFQCAWTIRRCRYVGIVVGTFIFDVGLVATYAYQFNENECQFGVSSGWYVVMAITAAFHAVFVWAPCESFRDECNAQCCGDCVADCRSLCCDWICCRRNHGTAHYRHTESTAILRSPPPPPTASPFLV